MEMIVAYCAIENGLPCLGENPFCTAALQPFGAVVRCFAQQELRCKKIVAGHGTVVEESTKDDSPQ